MMPQAQPTVVDRAIASRFAPYWMSAFLVSFPVLFAVLMLPLFGRVLSHIAPESILRALDREMLTQFETVDFPSRLTPNDIERTQKLFDELKTKAGVPHATLVIRTHYMENAFALAGGTVVLLEPMMRRLNEQELAAVLAHELGHIRDRHAMQKLFSWGAIRAVLIPLMSHDRSGAKVADALGGNTLLNAYSRDFEREADAFAHTLLAATGRDPAKLATAFETMQAATEKRHPSRYLSTHPATNERIAAARDASQRLKR